MIIGIAGTRFNKKRLGEGTGRTTLALAMMYHLLKEEYKEQYTFESFCLCFKTKRLRDMFTKDKFTIPCVYISEDILLKEMVAPLLDCTEEDLYDKDFLVRPINELKTNVIYLNNSKQRAIVDKVKASNYIRNRNLIKPAYSDNNWTLRHQSPTPLTILEDLKNTLFTNIHPSTVLILAIKKHGKDTLFFYPNLNYFNTFKLIKSLGGATIHIDNPNKKGNKKPNAKETVFFRNEFDYEVINNKDIENIYREASVIISDLKNGI